MYSVMNEEQLVTNCSVAALENEMDKAENRDIKW